MGFVRHCVVYTVQCWHGGTPLWSALRHNSLMGLGGLRGGGTYYLRWPNQVYGIVHIVTMQKVFGLVGALEARPIVGKTNYRVLVQQTNPTHHALSLCMQQQNNCS